MNNHRPFLLDAVLPDGEDEITAEHAPDPGLLHHSSRRSRPPGAAGHENPQSGVSLVPSRRRVPEPPPPRPPPTIRTVALENMKMLLDRFTQDAGPAARPILVQELQRLQTTPERFPLLLCGQLLSALGSRLDDSETRARFVADAQRILQEDIHV